VDAAGADDWLYELAWVEQDRSELPAVAAGSYMLLSDDRGVGDALARRLTAAGAGVTTVAGATTVDDLGRMLDDAAPPNAIVYLWALDAPDRSATAAARETQRVLRLMQTVARASASPRLIVVTRGAQPAGDDELVLTGAPLWGAVRALAHEHPELRPTAIDLPAAAGPEAAALLLPELVAGDEPQVALRSGNRYVARLRRVVARDAEARQGLHVPAAGRYRLEVGRGGVLDELAVRASARRAPAAGEVEVEVAAAGLNFRDVMKAMDVYPADPGDPRWLGDECAGTVVAVGEGVEGVEVGAEVMAVAPGCFGSHAVTRAELVVPKPASLSFEQAAATPIAFLTAHYALRELARLRRGERCLIHAAAGGVGLAAVQIAALCGAEIYATAGSDEKRELLRSLGVRHVMDSRSTAFADEILELTAGAGVDVVLNSLAGEAIPRSLSLLRPCGRFLEIGKRDIYADTRIGLRALKDNVAFFAIDLDRLLRERPGDGGTMLQGLAGELERGVLEPLPVQSFALAEAPAAFRQMAQARHTGKLVLRAERGGPGGDEAAIRPDGAYLVTGGLGGLGLTVAEWLVARGATRLVLAGRRPPSAEVEERLRELRSGGAQVEVRALDVADGTQVEEAVSEVQRTLGPLRGVIHAAGTLADAFVANLTEDEVERVLRPKVAGAANLHDATRAAELDFFVLFSSGIGVLGAPGQANYAAANAFLDALAVRRRRDGLPALSIAWGAWADVGMAASGDRRSPVSQAGVITPQLGLEALGRLLAGDRAAVAVLPTDWARFAELFPGFAASPLLAEVVGDAGGGPRAGGAALETILSAAADERPARIEEFLAAELSRVLEVQPDELDPVTPLNTIGLDSLMALELKNRVELALALNLPIVGLVEGPTIRAVAAQIGALLEDAEEGGAAGPSPEEAADLLEGLDEMADHEVDALLAQLGDGGR
jgi:NADPH:quinone reductase-like Zn-dependent oxidoreductase